MGRQDYKTDDESDTAAVGVAWLLQANLLMQKMRAESLEKLLKINSGYVSKRRHNDT